MNARRTLLFSLTAAIAAAALPAAAQNGDFPNKPVRLIVSAAPGGISDVLGRLVGQKLSVLWGKPVVVENKAGAAGHLAGSEVAKSAADGYTLLVGTMAHNGVMAIYPNLPYRPEKDLKPVILLGESSAVLVVNPSFPAKTLSEFLAMAKADPGKISYGSAGAGSATHMAAALFEYTANVKLTHVPYRGSGPALNDLLGGQIPAMFDNITSSQPYIKAGKLRALGVTSPKRQPGLPDVPTIAEAGVPGYASVSWYTISVPSGVPAAVVQKLNADLDKVLRAPDLRERLDQQGVTVLGGSVDDALKRNAQEVQRWSKVIQSANIVAE